MSLTELIEKGDILKIGISEVESIIAKCTDLKSSEQRYSEAMTAKESEYYKNMDYMLGKYTLVSLHINSKENSNSHEWFMQWMRSYAESITGRVIEPKFITDMYIWKKNDNGEFELLCKPDTCKIRDGIFDDFYDDENFICNITLKVTLSCNVFTKDNLEKRGKELSYLLRHDGNYNFDEHGYREVKDLIDNHSYSQELLEAIVKTNNKQRYEFSEDKTKIRARQGHSIDVNVDLKETTPPDILYHGTAIRFIEEIEDEGIKKMSRQYVHLTTNKETAFETGKRHGRPCVIIIDAKQMYNDGIKFYLSNNNVWLTDYVDNKYIVETVMNAKK